MTNVKLPKGWIGSSIDNTGQYINGMAFKPTDWKETGTPIIRIKNLTNPSAPINRTSRAVSDSVKVTKGTILVSWSATLDAFIWDREDAVLNQHIFKVVPDESVVTKPFLFYLLRSEIAAMREGEHLHGSTMKHINRGPFLAHEIALAPLAEQKRIADKLEAVLGRVDACRARLARVPALLKRFRQSVLAAATSGRLTEEWRMTNGVNDEWQNTELGSLISDGPKNGLYKSSTCYGQGTRILRIDNFYAGFVSSWEGLKRLTVSDAELNDFGLEVRDIVVNRVNSMSHLGKSALVRDLPEPCVFESNMMRLRLDLEQLMPEFCILVLTSPNGIEQLQQNAKQAVNQASINQTDVKSVIVSLPTLPEQAEIVRRVEDLFAFADRIEARLATAQKTVERLTPATLAKAFRGELVPQDPSDEPASALLEGLKSVQALAPQRNTRKLATRRVSQT